MNISHNSWGLSNSKRCREQSNLVTSRSAPRTTRGRALPGLGSGMSPWRERLFAVKSGLARSATAFYGLPPDRIVELGSQVKLQAGLSSDRRVP